MRKFINRAVASATLATVLLVLASSWEPAETKPKVDPCQQRHDACVTRCIERYDQKPDHNGRNQTMNCMTRTCDKQKANCDRVENPKSPKSSPPPKAEGSPGNKANDPKPKKGIDAKQPPGNWVPSAKPKKGIDATRPPGNWVPSPKGTAPNLRSRDRR